MKKKNNVQEQSLIKQGMTQEEVDALSDEQILALLIKQKRKDMLMNDANRRASIRRRRTPVSARRK